MAFVGGEWEVLYGHRNDVRRGSSGRWAVRTRPPPWAAASRPPLRGVRARRQRAGVWRRHRDISGLQGELRGDSREGRDVAGVDHRPRRPSLDPPSLFSTESSVTPQDTPKSQLKSFWSIPRVAAAFVVAYLSTGTAFYSFAESWSPIDALYFVVQAGLNVGYGDMQPTNPLSRLFTAAYLLAGNLLLGGALGLFVRQSLKRQEQQMERRARAMLRRQQRRRQKLARGMADAAHSADGIASLTIPWRSLQWRWLFTDPPRFLRTGGELVHAYRLRIEALAEETDTEPTVASAVASAVPLRGLALLASDMQVLWARFISSPLGSVVSSYSLLWVWIGAGTLFGITHEHLPFAEALLFSVSSLSTLGLSPPPSSDVVSHAFCIVFLLSGVAVYAATLGRVADFFVCLYERQTSRQLAQQEAQAREAIDTSASSVPDPHTIASALAWKAEMRRTHPELLEGDEVHRSAAQGNGSDGAADASEASLSWAEFLEWRLLRDGDVSVERVAAIREEFKRCFQA
ncbi:hypothetical protein CDCA_CDCA09G2769 [Cyanidium caldarium]|uniref:Potassium channel domain-containing protein n=1 Tax=Cyanidium caldarium TaxID=2771 RepID=A0AAV9IWU1_CYACA|nr:hypothetical protein CDCA_CDCA09G2769 [Cyanidium caldarium]